MAFRGKDSETEALRRELMARLVSLGDELVQLADDLGETIAGAHICQGVEMLRERLESKVRD